MNCTVSSPLPPPTQHQTVNYAVSSPLPPPTQHQTVKYPVSSPLSSSSTDSINVNPFYLKKLQGNIRVCQGCRGSLRLLDGTIPAPPFDIVVARVERRPYRDAGGTLKYPARPSAAHYHFRLSCIRSAEPSFSLLSLVVPMDITTQLTAQHKHPLQLDFGL